MGLFELRILLFKQRPAQCAVIRGFLVPKLNRGLQVGEGSGEIPHAEEHFSLSKGGLRLGEPLGIILAEFPTQDAVIVPARLGITEDFECFADAGEDFRGGLPKIGQVESSQSVWVVALGGFEIGFFDFGRGGLRREAQGRVVILLMKGGRGFLDLDSNSLAIFLVLYVGSRAGGAVGFHVLRSRACPV